MAGKADTCRIITVWRMVKHVTNGFGGVEHLAIAAEGRSIRMFGIQRRNQYGYSLWEFEVYSGGVNVARGKPVTVSSIEENNQNYVGSNAVDGNLTTRWSSVPRLDPQYIYIDLGKNTLIDSVVLCWEPAYAMEYEIQLSPDPLFNVGDETMDSIGLTQLSDFDVSPNPFNPQVTIGVQCKRVDLGTALPRTNIFDLQGRLLARLTPSLVKQDGNIARIEYLWNGTGFSSGVYIVAGQSGGRLLKKKILMLK